ncbi:NIPSNAP family protein [Streptomyces sp. NPDC057496]|uniref:NIPSNAP family protein n=1 Tax=Streptomyces sp. NPDC057496 TaxID=3346149 RepID=UPI0036CCE5F3
MVLEICTYLLKPGTGLEFSEVMREESVPLLRRAGIRVVDHGASMADEDGREEAYLIRAFSSMEQRHRQKKEFYDSDAWRQGPREAIVSRILESHTVVLDPEEGLARALRTW